MSAADATPLIAGNWKMNGALNGVGAVQALGAHILRTRPEVTVVVCPPATLLSAFAPAAGEASIALGAQDCHSEVSGAYTGDLSPEMLADAGARYCIVGHSERRAAYGEHDGVVRGKAEASIRAGLIPIICVGETLEQREAGHAESVVREMVRGSVPNASATFVLAYEPVWAIGTGRVPTQDDIAGVMAVVREEVGGGVALLYGGSAKAKNADELLAVKNVDGLLVGGASLDADEFAAIIDAGDREAKRGATRA